LFAASRRLLPRAPRCNAASGETLNMAEILRSARARLVRAGADMGTFGLASSRSGITLQAVPMNRLFLCALLALSTGASAQALNPAAAPPAPPSAMAAKLAEIKDPTLAIQAAMQFRNRGELSNEAEAWARAVKLRPHV
jgi:hypothetical protein